MSLVRIRYRGRQIADTSQWNTPEERTSVVWVLRYNLQTDDPVNEDHEGLCRCQMRRLLPLTLRGVMYTDYHLNTMSSQLWNEQRVQATWRRALDEVEEEPRDKWVTLNFVKLIKYIQQSNLLYLLFLNRLLHSEEYKSLRCPSSGSGTEEDRSRRLLSETLTKKGPQSFGFFDTICRLMILWTRTMRVFAGVKWEDFFPWHWEEWCIRITIWTRCRHSYETNRGSRQLEDAR